MTATSSRRRGPTWPSATPTSRVSGWLPAPGTDVEGGNRCQRSTSAYAHLVSQCTGTELVFRACSGARTGDFYQDNTAWDEPTQLGALSADTDLVTFSVGGNDTGFAEVLGECLSRAQQGDRDPCSTDEQLVSRVGSAIDALRGTGVREGTCSLPCVTDLPSGRPEGR
ncbi:GDSL-type esterase/lipase family protein [Actinomyces wuliandei]|uniref:GDSL-type esterase/lipase family protein n=1 Tax=Actinomyces wuliandei TaxID=2057743 RepID=UPI0019D4C798|nr:GDSL-type esterase/lipase family protein [Actinomyces wuliandei]